jgi:hypothetical protein
MQQRVVHIDDIPEDGIELAEEQLAKLLGGMRPGGGGGGGGTSKTGDVDGGTDSDSDF